MPSLAEICEQLLRVNEKIPIKLLVVSNDFNAYQKMIAGFPFLSAYKKWNYRHIFDDISGADVCVIPNSKDDFSRCKSPNRTLLALSLGVPVVATDVSSIDDLKNCVILDEWENGLFTYLNDPQRVARDIARAKLILDEKYSSNAVARLWDELFQTCQIN
jgi:glycosyltransferase involved in cell wall biosynthesis